MLLGPDYRTKLAKAGAMGVGVLAVLWLHGALHPKFDWNSLAPKPLPVKISVSRAAPAESAAVVAKVPKELPVRTEKAAPQPVKKKLRKQEAPSVAEAPIIANNELMTLSQPAISPERAQKEAESLPPLLPPVSSEAAPPAPGELSDTFDYPETPGGNILVLELFINDQGIVTDARIAVPSYDGLSDLALHSAALGQKWTNLEPPLRPGETRRLELRIPYTTRDNRFNPLP